MHPESMSQGVETKVLVRMSEVLPEYAGKPLGIPDDGLGFSSFRS